MQTAEGAGMSSGAELAYSLKSNFLAGLTADEQLRIFDLSARTARALHPWVARYPLIRRVRVWPLCLSVAAASPFCAVSSLVSMARMSLWVFTIDDLCDEEIVPYNELHRRVDRYQQLLHAGQVVPREKRDTLANALQDIREDLARYPLFSHLESHWVHAVSQTLSSMLMEYGWRSTYRSSTNTQVVPTYEAYLEHGVYSIGGPPHVWTTLIAIDDPSTLEHLPRLQQMEYEASLCIRLANDLQSYAKELNEGKINSIIIRQRELIASGVDAEIALEQAHATVQAAIQHGLARCTELQHLASTATGHPEQAIADIARFVCDFYVHHDYHTFTTGSGRL
jgi:Terpene synthase family 2, C-terminal metal binding